MKKYIYMVSSFDIGYERPMCWYVPADDIADCIKEFRKGGGESDQIYSIYREENTKVIEKNLDKLSML